MSQRFYAPQRLSCTKTIEKTHARSLRYSIRAPCNEPEGNDFAFRVGYSLPFFGNSAAGGARLGEKGFTQAMAP